MATSIDDVRTLLNSTKQDFLHRSNVVATGVGYKVTESGVTSEPSLICSVSKKIPAAELLRRDLIPKSIDGIHTDVVGSGIIRAFTQNDRLRPAPGGISIGHFDITAGTLGCLVKRNGQTFILSNNHVIANSNDARPGDAILQPGPIDGGNNPNDKIAELSEFITIHYQGDGGGGSDEGSGGDSNCSIAQGVASGLNTIASMMGSQARMQAVTTRNTDNFVDAAIARPLNDNLVDSSILGIGEIAGVREGELGMAVQKSGRTTDFTTGTIQQIDVTVNVQYGAGRIAQFTDQLVAGPMSQGGDSGSAVLDMDKNIVGLLFAGSDRLTIMNRIQRVFTELDISL